MTLADKLRAVPSHAPTVTTAHAASQGLGREEEVDPVTSLSDQLDSVYADIDYLTQKFPRHNVRSLVDYALSLQERVTQGPHGASGQTAGAHGMIPAEAMAQISAMTQAVADTLPLGLVEVDDGGVIKIYNTYEQQLAGVARENALGRNFFLDVAPCTNNKLFFGRFKSGVEAGLMDQSFNYTFTYKMKPTPVAIHLYRDASSGRNFIFVKKR